MSPSHEEQIAIRQRFSDSRKGQVEEALEKLDADPSSEFNVNIESMIISCNHRFYASTQPPGYWAIDLHDLWRQFMWCAKGTPAGDTRQDLRAMQILHMRELGVAVNTAGETPREALTPEGERIWIDLPYLVADFRHVWENALDMKPSHMDNLAAFTARMAGVGVCKNELTFCMLQLCKQVLETELPAEGPTLPVLLPAISRWFIHCGEKLNRLCIGKHTFADGVGALPRSLARAAGVKDTGFSVARWLFWRKTVKDFALSGDENLAAEGKRVFDKMMMVGRITQNKLPGESRYWDKVDEAMHHELLEREKTGGRGVVNMEEVASVIDLNWVDDPEEQAAVKAHSETSKL